MASIPMSLFLVLFVQSSAGDSSCPSLPEAVQLLQLETIRGLKQTILEKEDENQKLKSEIDDLKNKELDEISERLHQSEMTVTYMIEVMLHSNQMMVEQDNLLKVQAGAIQDFNEKVKVGENCSRLLGETIDIISLQEAAIDLLESSLVTSRNFSETLTELSTSSLEKMGQMSELIIHLADLRSALESVSINVDTLEQQAHMIKLQGRSIALLTPLLRRTNSSDILWFDNTSRSTRGVAGVAKCSCLPRSDPENQLWPVRVDYQCQGDTNRTFQLPCHGGVCSLRELPSCTDDIFLGTPDEEVFHKCQELSFKGASVLCGINGTKETRRKLHIGGGIVEETVASASCKDCGDLSTLEWTPWASCEKTTEAMLCRRRGNAIMGYEEEEFVCAAPWTQLSTGCYRFHETMLTQSEAKKFCEDEQQVPSRLVEIDSAEENNVIIAEIKRRNFFSQKLEFWLGITDRHSEGQWVLESTGERLVFANWSSSREPTNQHENCAHMSAGKNKWIGRRCDSKTGRGKWQRTALCEI